MARLPWPARCCDAGARASGYFFTIDHPDIGAQTVCGPPWTVDGRRDYPTRAPLLGEHTAEVLAELAN